MVADAAWREQVRAERPVLGRLVTALTPKPEASQGTRAWEVGAQGEVHVAEILNRCEHAYSLHDRQVPGTKANIDHVALGPAAVYVIDAKRYTGRVERRGDHLYVNGWKRTHLVEGVRRQVATVRQALAEHDVPVRGVLCFVGAEWPPLAPRLLPFADVVAMCPTRLSTLVAEPGPMTVARTMELARRLAVALPIA